jgi:hypothetical protein
LKLILNARACHLNLYVVCPISSNEITHYFYKNVLEMSHMRIFSCVENSKTCPPSRCQTLAPSNERSTRVIQQTATMMQQPLRYWASMCFECAIDAHSGSPFGHFQHI